MTRLQKTRRVLRRAGPVRLSLVAGVLSAAEVILPLYADAIPRGVFALLSLVTVTGAMLARAAVQQEQGDDR
jgi:hypothetical protein